MSDKVFVGNTWIIQERRIEKVVMNMVACSFNEAVIVEIGGAFDDLNGSGEPRPFPDILVKPSVHFAQVIQIEDSINWS